MYDAYYRFHLGGSAVAVATTKCKTVPSSCGGLLSQDRQATGGLVGRTLATLQKTAHSSMMQGHRYIFITSTLEWFGV